MQLSFLQALASSYIALATPILQSHDDSNPSDLANEFKGIYWDYAFKKDDSGNQECSTDQIKTFLKVLQKTKNFMGTTTDTSRKDFNTDGAWHKFYIRPNPSGKTVVTNDWTEMPIKLLSLP